jgi:flagellar biosynthesis GTPase FlhF
MELKRIIARDTRAANQKAVALYGPDVLVISSSKVRGQTELIVAVDVPPISIEAAVAETFVPTEKTYALSKESSTEESIISPTGASFGQVMEETMTRQKASSSDKAALPAGFVSAAALKSKAKAVLPPEAAVAIEVPTPAAATVNPVAVQAAQEERDTLRGREIVELVRE